MLEALDFITYIGHFPLFATGGRCDSLIPAGTNRTFRFLFLLSFSTPFSAWLWEVLCLWALSLPIAVELGIAPPESFL